MTAQVTFVLDQPQQTLDPFNAVDVIVMLTKQARNIKSRLLNYSAWTHTGLLLPCRCNATPYNVVKTPSDVPNNLQSQYPIKQQTY